MTLILINLTEPCTEFLVCLHIFLLFYVNMLHLSGFKKQFLIAESKISCAS